MAGLEGLASMIYHEKQQPGSMLCAQHALNSLLQGNYFTAPDLSSIAESLDALEDSYRDENEAESRNMDDTGFFSVQVLENALKVWGLNLVRWRSEEMRPYNDRPHTQLAFILNLEQHWFTLRRFGPAVPNIDADPGEGHWFNLNSFLSAPEWVGKLYLGMVLQQAETEGYSVFAVTQADPESPLALPRTEADEIAATLPEPSSASTSISTNRKLRNAMEASSSSPHEGVAGQGAEEHFDDEDYELQMALQASLAQEGMDLDDATSPPPMTRGTVPLPPSNMQSPVFSEPHTPLQSGLFAAPPAIDDDDDDDNEELDPVAASMARSRQLLERMQQEQAYAAREMWSEADLSPEEAEALQQRREARRLEEEREEEELRRAIEESERMAREYNQGSSKSQDDDDDDVEIIEDDGIPGSRGQSGSAPNLTPAYYGSDRVYDDDDAELQAALKASLENLPPGFQTPMFEDPAPPVRPNPPAPAPAPMSAKDREDNLSVASTETESQEPEPVEEPLSVDEIRRRRLARFGA